MGRTAALAAGAAAGFLALLLLLIVVAAGSDDGAGAALGLPGVVCAPAGGTPGAPVAGFANDQLANASSVVAAGAEVGVPQRGQVIAVAVAMQESNLHNLSYGDRDSIGLFQQRSNWGPSVIRMDPKAAAKLFYARLLALPGWASLPLTVAAQRIQGSATPDAYAKWESKADMVVGAVLGITCQPGQLGPGQPPVANPLAAEVVRRALSQLGVPYAWGGGNASGPSRGIPGGGPEAVQAGDTGKIGFDCSGLMVYAFAGVGVTVPHQTQAIWQTFGPPITDRGQIQPGDMIMASDSGQASGIDHVGLYLGNGQVVHAPESGSTVRIVPNIWTDPWWSKHFVGAVRAHPGPRPNPT